MGGPTPRTKVLFVCMGNICRSPAAEGVFASLVAQAGYSSQIAIDSAGTHGYHIDHAPDPRMLRAAARRGYELTSKARRVTVEDLETCDWVVAMDEENREFLQKMTAHPRQPIRLMSEFLSDSHWPTSVPDPYYQDDQSFDFVLDMLEATAPALLDHVLKTLDQPHGSAGAGRAGAESE